MSADESVGEMSTFEVSPIMNILGNHGVELPNYISRLLVLTGYANLQSLSKLNDSDLIHELEQYTTDNLDASDLGLSEKDVKYYFNRHTKKFNILPGHKHLLADAAETARKLLCRAEEDVASSQLAELDHQHKQQQQQQRVDEKSSMRALHFLSEFASLSSSNGRTQRRRRNNPPKTPTTPIMSNVSVEEEHQSLTEYLKTWIARKVLMGQLEPFVLEVDYRVNVFRPKSNGNQPIRPDVYSFVCLRCNTTIKAFKRPNGSNWNAANVCRHLAIVHCHPNLVPPKSGKKRSCRETPSTLLALNLSSNLPTTDSRMEEMESRDVDPLAHDDDD